MEQKKTYSEVKVTHTPLVRWTLLFAGTVFVGIGILGIFLPLLPTTVFLLMAAWCYARSSDKYYHWLHHNKVFGRYLKNYREGKGITVGSKIFIIALLWGGILYSIFVTQVIVIQIVLFAIAVGVTIHIIVIPSHRSE